MKLLKPTWVSHDALPIFSVDIHPDGSRFATGGQGEDSGRVVVWNMAPVVSEDDENNENVPKMLCQMDNHLACVNCVRWSMSGKFLASGGDDKLIMIWKISKYATGGAVFGGGGKVNVEQWRCVCTLRGHGGDVLDMAWSPHDAWLASCSVDNTVIIWNALKLPVSEVVAVLKGHTGLVKGVAWDPVGKYVASQSDDKSLRVWRTVDWQQEVVITEPFDECGGTTHVLRPSWSPDGQYLVSAHAMNGGGPTAQIIEREGWRQDKDFVGHRKAITCVRFNSNILQKFSKQVNKPQQYCCCAIGSRDRSLSVWLTALKRPLVVIHDLFTNSVLDLSWSITGLQLIACSWDGSIVYVEFSENELGKPLSVNEKGSLLERIYGKSLFSGDSQNMASATIIENPELLKLKEQNEKSVSHAETTTEKPVISTPMKGPLNKQIETRTSDGKRRITPMYIPTAPDVGDAPQPFNTTTSQPTFSSSSEPKSKIVIEKRDDIVHPNVSTPTQSKKHPFDANSVISATVSSCGAEDLSAAPKQSMLATTSADVPAVIEGKLQIEKIQEKASYPVKRKLDKDQPKMPGKRGRPPLSEKMQMQSPIMRKDPELMTKEVSIPAAPREPGIRLPALRLRNKTIIQVPETQRTVEVENATVPSPYGLLNQIRCSGRGGPAWDVVFGSPVCAAVANKLLYAVVCEDCTLHTFDVNGKRPLPPLVLSSLVTKLSVNGWHVMAVTTRGNIYVWNIKEKKALVKNESMLPIMVVDTESVVTILSCSVSDEGSPMVSLSTGRAYLFSTDLSTWLLMGNSNDPVQKSSRHQPFMKSFDPGNASTPLKTLQSHMRSPAMSAAHLIQGSPAGMLSTMSYLELQLAACETLKSSQEYHYWLLAFVRFLVQEGMEAKLRLLCDDLLGPTHSRASLSQRWESHYLGLPKHDLLKEILAILGSNLRLQRLYIEYSDQLSMLKMEKPLISKKATAERDKKRTDILRSIKRNFEVQNSEKKTAKVPKLVKKVATVEASEQKTVGTVKTEEKCVVLDTEEKKSTENKPVENKQTEKKPLDVVKKDDVMEAPGKEKNDTKPEEVVIIEETPKELQNGEMPNTTNKKCT